MPPTEGDNAAHQAEDMPPTSKNSAAHYREHTGGDREGTYSQQDVIAIGQDSAMRSEFSELTDAEILVRVDGREVRWFNAFAKKQESAVVMAANASKNHPPKITGHVTPNGDDTRILHFLEVGSGFRSLAVGRLRSIG